MFKEINSQASTKQIRKTKLLDSYRQNSTNTQRNKIMLTDLCPEEKAKIGDLVRTLETRKSQNYSLEQKIKQLQKKQTKHIDKINQLEKIIQEGRQKQLKLKQQLTLIKIKQQERERYIEHLLAEKQQNNKQLMRRKQVPCVDQFSLTDPIISISQGVQAIPKKKKNKQKQVQTQANSFNEEGRKYPNNSKSFQKIMRGRVHSHGNQASPLTKSGERNRFKVDKKNYEQRSKKSQIIINDDEDEQNEQVESQERNEQQIQQNQDDDFNQLAKKWLELKEKNMSKIKESYKKSKQKVSNQKSLKKISKSIGVPRQFNQKNNPQHQDEESSFMNQENNLHHNQSFGPKKSKKKQKRKQSEQVQREGEAQAEQFDKDFDEIELNKILKLKNFSASRLLNKNHQLSSQQSERQKYGRYEKEEKKLKRSNNIKVNEYQNTPNMKMSLASNSRSNNIDFYETDLLDIVSSINRR